MTLRVLKTKYAFHLLLWLLEPDVVLDIGSMDGADSKRFRQLLPRSRLVAFEGNPDNYQTMINDPDLERNRVRVLNLLVADQEGERSFYVQRSVSGAPPGNRGTSSFTPRTSEGMKSEETRVRAVRADLFLDREYPEARRVAAWIDVEGHAYTVLEGMTNAIDRIDLVHIEVETKEIWPAQKLEKDVLVLAGKLGMIPVACGAGETQRDLVLASERWLARNRRKVHTLLFAAGIAGPMFAGIVRGLVRLRRTVPGRSQRA